jgi:hypothetical protein
MYDVPDLPEVLRARSSQMILFREDQALFGLPAGVRLVLQADHVNYGEDELESVSERIMAAGLPHLKQLTTHNEYLLLCSGCEDKELHGAVRVLASRRLRCMSISLSLTVIARDATLELTARLEAGMLRVMEIITNGYAIRRPAIGWDAPIEVCSGLLVNPPDNGRQLLELQDDAFGVGSAKPEYANPDDPSLFEDIDTQEFVTVDDPEIERKLNQYIRSHGESEDLPELVPVDLGRLVS